MIGSGVDQLVNVYKELVFWTYLVEVKKINTTHDLSILLIDRDNVGMPSRVLNRFYDDDI